jgi:hypothetical protein
MVSEIHRLGHEYCTTPAREGQCFWGRLCNIVVNLIVLLITKYISATSLRAILYNLGMVCYNESALIGTADRYGERPAPMRLRSQLCIDARPRDTGHA